MNLTNQVVNDRQFNLPGGLLAKKISFVMQWFIVWWVPIHRIYLNPFLTIWRLNRFFFGIKFSNLVSNYTNHTVSYKKRHLWESLRRISNHRGSFRQSDTSSYWTFLVVAGNAMMKLFSYSHTSSCLLFVELLLTIVAIRSEFWWLSLRPIHSPRYKSIFFL